ncbi:MAG: 30S ribosomal protein S6 [Candidatus Chromulinivorax sp.]
MLRYEMLFLTVPEITGDEVESIKSYFQKAVRAAQGDMLSFERWGKYRLAYQVKKNDYGVYFLTRFEVALENRDALLKDIRSSYIFKFNHLIMKNMITRLNEKGSLEYKRPESLEDTPQDVDSFLKKNEMEGLLKTKGGFKNKRAEEKSVIGGVAGTKENKVAVPAVFEEDELEDFEDSVE